MNTHEQTIDETKRRVSRRAISKISPSEVKRIPPENERRTASLSGEFEESHVFLSASRTSKTNRRERRYGLPRPYQLGNIPRGWTVNIWLRINKEKQDWTADVYFITENIFWMLTQIDVTPGHSKREDSSAIDGMGMGTAPTTPTKRHGKSAPKPKLHTKYSVFSQFISFS